MLPCTRFPNPEWGWLVPVDRPRLVRFVRYSAVVLLVLVLLAVAVTLIGAVDVVGALIVETVMLICVAVGTRVEGSTLVCSRATPVPSP